MIEIKIIDDENKSDINIPNEEFFLIGKLIPKFLNQKWDYDVEYFSSAKSMCFPNESYDYDKMKVNSVFVGAYVDGKCVGLAILQDSMFKYMYLYDLKVSKDFRKHHIGQKLIEKAKQICLEKGYNGIYTQAQDNNLIACLFYLKNGFYIGGLDTNIYRGTKQEGKSDIIFYLDC